ncbi:uncharacterized protein si:dkey-246e1.3 isoform X2 [Oryzias melastigma]|uniref:uncharacterized protein si:dkey-246e1.3 isoform X2 n=1 Tax=Oryzias melastigma TaxID=30732 RepID=UPI00168CD80D|nr:uncharacterized protein si:dkey-246e1.3 isoform X2 [Oryzias melastigma]
MSAENLHLNRTAERETPDGKMNASAFEFRVLNIIIITVALCILMVTGLYCLSVCYSRTRQSKRAHIYESAVSGGEPEEAVTVKAVKRSTSFINPLAFFRRPEAAKDNSRIYYIYANPLPVGLKEEEEETHSRTPEQTPLTPSLSMQEYARRPSSGLVLDPPMFYLQL